MKLCRDCQHCAPATEHDTLERALYFATCEAIKVVSPVSGAITHPFCSVARQSADCGPDGKLYEASTGRDDGMVPSQTVGA